MPVVPVYERNVSLQPEGGRQFGVRASAEAFGADIGRGLQQLGAGASQAAQAFQQVEDLKATLTAKDNLTSFEREKMELDYGPNGFMTQQGKNAVDGKDGYFKALEELKKKYAPTQPLAAQKYDSAATAAVTDGMRGGIVHAAQGQKDWAASSSTARLSLYTDQALNGYDKPAEIQKSLALGYAEIDEQAKLMGWSPDVVKFKRSEFSSTIHTNVAMAMASQPRGAKAAVEYVKAHGEEMDPKARLDIENKLRPFVVDEQAQGVVADILAGGRVADQPGDMVAEVLAAGPKGNGAGPTRSKAYLMQKSAHPDRPGDTTNLDDSFADNLAAMIQDAPPWIRDGLGIGSGFRSNERQIELFENSDKTGHSVAFPAGYKKPDGSIAKGSNHLHGRAVDLSFNGQRLDKAPKAVQDWVQANAAAYGLRFPMSWEPWHIEPGAGSTVVPARDGVSARATMPSYETAMAKINAIEDPEVRAAAMKQFGAQLEFRSKLDNMQSEDAKKQIFTMMMQGTPLTQIPLDLKISAGREAVSGFMDFEAKAGNVQTNPDAYSKLNEMAATSPQEFAKLDLTAPEILNSLSREDWKAMENRKTNILSDQRKAVEEGKVYTQAYKVAEELYPAAGILTGNSKDAQSADNLRREAQFREAMRLETQQFIEANKGRQPSYEEMRAMAAALTMRAIATQPRTGLSGKLFGGESTEWEGPLFQRLDAPGGTDIKPQPDFKDVPADWVSAITVALTKRNGQPPTKQEIAEEWGKVVMELIGAN